MDREALEFIGLLVAILSGFGGLILTLMLHNADRNDRNTGGKFKNLERTSERTQDRQIETVGDLAEMAANVRTLMSDRGKCDELASEVAVLKDFKSRAEAKFDEVDEASRELRGMAEQIKTAFRRMEELPKAITAEVLSSVPRVVLETLNAARALQPQQNGATTPGRALNG